MPIAQTIPASMRGLDKDIVEALIETMFLAARSDDDFGEEERVHFAASVLSLTHNAVAGPALDDLIAHLGQDLATEGRPARLTAVKDRLKSNDLRILAFSLAIRVVAADGIIRTTERELLLDLAEALDLDRDAAADLVKRAAV
jgi:tellurite resistance protein